MTANTTAANQSQAEEQQSNESKQNENSITSKFKQLPSEKQFGLITLAALGTAMLVTGRTVRVIMKRVATTDPPPQVMPHPAADLSKLEVDCSKLSTSIQADIRTSKSMKTSTRFWDNKSILCVGERNDDDDHLNSSKADQEKAMDFNPAMDAMNAFGLATLLVIGTSVLTIGGLSKRWELDGWDDWRIFIQSGHLGKVLIPKDWSQSVSKAIPEQLRPNSTPLSEQEIQHENEIASSWEWKKTVDLEWEIEKNRREAERLQWEARRKMLGKRIW
ncbi:hypothetical protein MJO29_000843 [Puccinia striiformis f. sp. tritici]|uniref:Transmembrane protein n=1 Tax=Puccinia striiformis TaxID=27350 RepID=A0A2S4UWB1_9BASI|nr:hypothetical protein Pst134EB_002058 [Puccinia striiformis f. sp. tritici]KAI7967566.1 hypothetical protein MJO29_000843 [Puccinia striiformis f. sp. tritici]POW01556.1 hypothetical protein PSTT_12458 [Puccinia striiformis]